MSEPIKSQLILELTELHAQLRWAHQECMDLLVNKGDITGEYALKNFKIIEMEKRQAQILWALADLITLSRT